MPRNICTRVGQKDRQCEEEICSGYARTFQAFDCMVGCQTGMKARRGDRVMDLIRYPGNIGVNGTSQEYQRKACFEGVKSSCSKASNTPCRVVI